MFPCFDSGMLVLFFFISTFFFIIEQLKKLGHKERFSLGREEGAALNSKNFHLVTARKCRASSFSIAFPPRDSRDYCWTMETGSYCGEGIATRASEFFFYTADPPQNTNCFFPHSCFSSFGSEAYVYETCLRGL